MYTRNVRPLKPGTFLPLVLRCSRCPAASFPVLGGSLSPGRRAKNVYISRLVRGPTKFVMLVPSLFSLVSQESNACEALPRLIQAHSVFCGLVV